MTIRFRHLRLTTAVVAAVGCFSLAFGAASASATTTTVTCNENGGTPSLQSTLDNVAQGDTVIIKGFCVGSFVLPAYNEAFYGGFTLEGAPGTTSGFDGQGQPQAGPLLYGTVPDSTTIANLTFKNAVTPTNPVSLGPTDYGSSALGIDFAYFGSDYTDDLTLSGDKFTNDAGANGYSPAQIYVFGDNDDDCATPLSDYALAIDNSTFEHDTLATNYVYGLYNGDGGGALSVISQCQYDASLVDNDFQDNSVSASGAPGVGGAVAFWNYNPDPMNLAQTGNVFGGNSVQETGTPYPYGGGGEWLDGANLTSIDDRFTDNTIPGSSGSTVTYGEPNWSWGAGLSILNSTCDPVEPTASTLADDIVASNTIDDSGGDDPTEAQGAAIYLGCAFSSNSNNLSIFDSTVTNNAVSPAGAGAVAGIYGDDTDNLTLGNTILYGDTGGAEYGGFNPSFGGTLTSTYSDLCDGAAPFTGTGNICADPLLIDNGNAKSLNVRETKASPTLDVGSNAIVPDGLTTDFYGQPREVLGKGVKCPSASAAGSVDIGAAEFQPCSTAVCVSVRAFTMHLRTDFDLPAVDLITHVVASYGPRRIDRYGKNIKTIFINMRHFAKGAYRVRITITLPDGSTRYLQHLFHICEPGIHYKHHKG